MALHERKKNRIRLNGFRFDLNQHGLCTYEKLSYPVRFGRFHQVTGHGFSVQFNLRGQPVFFHVEGDAWPHPHDRIKITPSGTLLYFSSGGYIDPFPLYGEYFVPVPQGKSNSLFPHNPFSLHEVKQAVCRLDEWIERLLAVPVPENQPQIRRLLEQIHAGRSIAPVMSYDFHRTIRGKIPILPPDTRHVLYDILPLLISDGCLSNCGFCTIKTSAVFRERSRLEIAAQAENLRKLLGPDLPNFNSVFLGQNDALACSSSLIEHATCMALSCFDISQSFMKHPMLFMFGSVESLLSADAVIFKMLENSGFRTYINIGFESFHQNTLEILKKPVRATDVKSAFQKACDLNRKYRNIEITGNFIVGTALPGRHMELLENILGAQTRGRPTEEITVYLSPLEGDENTRGLLRMTKDLQRKSCVPCHLYLLLGL